MKADKIKRRIKRRMKRHVLVFVLIQIGIIWFFVPPLLRILPPITLEDTNSVAIIVEEVNLREVARQVKRLEIESSGLTYHFHSDCSDDEYSIYELREAISIGEVIEAKYIEYRNYQFGFEKHLDIVDARSGNKVYRVFDVYKHRSESVFWFVLAVFLIIEAAYILIFYKMLWIEGVVSDIKKLFSKSPTRKGL